MTIRNRPNYGVYSFDLTDAAGLNETRIPVDLYVEGTRIALVSAIEDGEPVNAVVNVQIGRSLGDMIPFSVGTELVCQNKFDFARLTWSAQSGVTASFVISDDADGNGMSVSAYPAVSAADVSITEGGNTAKVNSDGQLEVAVTGSVSVGSVVVSSGSIEVTSGSIEVSSGTISIAGGGGATAIKNPALNSLPQSAASGTPQVQPGEAGTYFYAETGLSEGSNEVLAAASNVNGVVVRGAWLSAATSDFAMLCYGTSAPTSLTSNNPIAAACGQAAGPLNCMSHEVFVPGGNALYIYLSGSSNFCAVAFDVV